MNSSLLKFEWSVSTTGYELIRTEYETYIAVPIADGDPFPERDYEPLENQGLFLTFGTLDQTEQAMLDFANTYGLLGEYRMSRNFKFPDDYPELWGRSGEGEGLREWLDEAAELKGSMARWELIKRRDYAALMTSRSVVVEYYRWLRDQGRLTPDDYEELQCSFDDLVASNRRIEILWKAIEPDNPVLLRCLADADLCARILEESQYWLAEAINRKLAGRINPVLSVEDKRRATTVAMRFQPVSLIGAIWLQFALAVAEEAEFRSCETCSGWFRVIQETRFEKRYCSNKCKLKSYRLRQLEAVKLFADGATVEAIADHLNTDPETVRNWLDGRGGGVRRRGRPKAST